MNAIRERVARATARTKTAEETLLGSLQPWRARVSEHRTALTMAGGFAAGFAAASVPARWWGRLGRAALRSVVGAMRSVQTNSARAKAD
ncbi:MAG TPA: hypothetical protein VFB32_14020 [Rudaea sp.]|nr:hypothetical protein [Rudaea sp.]